MTFNRLTLLAVLLFAATVWGQTSVTEVLTAAGADPTPNQNGAPAPGGPTTKPAPATPPPTPNVPAPRPSAPVLVGPSETPAADAGSPTASAASSPEPVYLLSIYKAVIFLIVVGLWASLVSKLDKDLKFNHLPRETWNGIHMGVGALGFLLWLIIPMFWLGLFVALACIGGAFGGYAYYRNERVDESRRWRLSMDTFNALMAKRGADAALKAASVRILAPDGHPLPVPEPGEPLAAAHEALELIMEFALPRRAERVEVVADGTQTAVAVTIDGVKYPQAGLDAKVGMSMIDYVKQSAGMDVAERRRKQNGKLMFLDSENPRQAYKVTTIGSTKGLQLTLESDATGGPPMPLDKLGLVESQKKQLLAVLDHPGRVVIVACPPRHGQSTTLYTLTARHDPYTQSVIAMEEEAEFELEGVTIDKIPPGLDAAAINQKLKGAMLREAGIVLISKLADAGTASLMAEYANAARFYTGMKLEDTFTALRGWTKVLGEKSAAKSVQAIVSQRLVRRLCKTCRIPYKPDADVLRKLNVPADKVGQFYKHSGQVMVRDKPEICADCLGLGFKGRVGVFEVMALDDQARDMIAAGQLEPLRAYLRKQKMIWLQEAAMFKVIEGETSISEITRVMAPAKEAAK